MGGVSIGYAVAAFLWAALAVIVALCVWFLASTGPLGTCIPGAHPTVTLERCAPVQP